MSILIVVADAFHARLISADTNGNSLSEISDLVHPASREREINLIADDRGMGKDVSQFGRHSMGHEGESRYHEKQEFARQLCTEIDTLIKDMSPSAIYQIAPPEFTGILRSTRSKNTTKLIVQELKKDLVKHSIKDIRSHLPKRL
jgi:protein required for attachment to host cells